MVGRGGWQRWLAEVDDSGGWQRWMAEVDGRGGWQRWLAGGVGRVVGYHTDRISHSHLAAHKSPDDMDEAITQHPQTNTAGSFCVLH